MIFMNDEEVVLMDFDGPKLDHQPNLWPRDLLRIAQLATFESRFINCPNSVSTTQLVEITLGAFEMVR